MRTSSLRWPVVFAVLLGLLLPAARAELPAIKTVFLILLENHDWIDIRDTNHCPYINQEVLPRAAFAENYSTPPGLHPSEPNYIWLVAGTNFGIKTDKPPSVNEVDSNDHLAFQLDRAGIPWRAYQEGISGKDIPKVDKGNYAVRHNPFMFFKGINTDLRYCTNHIRPFTELAGDLASGRVGRFNFITPNLTNDMHNLAAGSKSTRLQGDRWLRSMLPGILASDAYKDRGAVFIVWDEGDEGAKDEPTHDGPIGMIALSPLGKGGGYHNSVRYTHSSTLRTFQEIFGVRPFLGDAAEATDLADLFQPAPAPRISVRSGPGAGGSTLSVLASEPGRTYRLQFSEDLALWTDSGHEVAAGHDLDIPASPAATRYFRLLAR